MNILVAILIFTVIIVIHELGHFLLAKKNGVFVTEFSVGMGPRLITLAKGEKGFVFRPFLSQSAFEGLEGCQKVTKYSWKLLPIGGSCMMLGEDEVVEDENAFHKKSVWARISVIFAGPFFNFLLAFLLSLIILSITGHDAPTISSLQEGAPMQEAGFQVGDEITKIDHSSIQLSREISVFFQFHPLSGEPVEIQYKRDGVKNTISVVPQIDTDGVYRLGFGFGSDRVKLSPLGVIKYSVIEVKYWIKLTIESLGQLIAGKVSKDDIAGPVGIVDMVGGAIQESKSYGITTTVLTILNMCILLSANLGVMNLLPIPALDGGRLVFLFLEVLRGKPVAQEKEGFVHLVGLVALMLLMAFVMYNDIARLL
ncbi:MAG: regulator of sigma protease [Clostridiales bacterium]|nr:regulator of sigma protease [Clostridiales bacterium]